MKEVKISVYVPHFCPKDCPNFHIKQSKLLGDNKTAFFAYECYKADECEMIYKLLKAERGDE